jgi:hypothetical protein
MLVHLTYFIRVTFLFAFSLFRLLCLQLLRYCLFIEACIHLPMERLSELFTRLNEFDPAIYRVVITNTLWLCACAQLLSWVKPFLVFSADNSSTYLAVVQSNTLLTLCQPKPVETRGLEPLTYALQRRRSPN